MRDSPWLPTLPHHLALIALLMLALWLLLMRAAF